MKKNERHTVIPLLEWLSSFSAIPDFEYRALKMLAEAEEKLREAEIALCLVALNPEPLRIIQHTPLGKTLGRERMFFTLTQAVDGYQRIVPVATA
jgi:hypothetical protein